MRIRHAAQAHETRKSNMLYWSVTSPTRDNIVGDHLYRLRYFKIPAYCPYCEDYIWGSGSVGYQCQQCLDYFHVECSLVISSGTCPVASGAKPSSSSCHVNNRSLITYDRSIPITDWSVSDVCEWLSVVNLYRYAPNFQQSKYDGVMLLTLNDEQLKHNHIHDQFQRRAILDAIKELKSREKYRPISIERFQPPSSSISSASSTTPTTLINDHGDNFICTTFYERRQCDLCEKYLYGIIHQGLQCSRCGIVVHRQCSKLPLKKCVHTNKQLECHMIIGTDFNDQPLDMKTQLPIIITRLCTTLEQMATENPSLSLIDAYRFSIESQRIAYLRKLINDNDIEKMDFKRMELSELASLVKVSLKEPGIGIIPDENYDDFLNLVNAPTQVVQEFVNNYSMPFYIDFLKFLMKHIITVWKLDYQSASMTANSKERNNSLTYDSEKLIDKLVAIFKQLIFRPPWYKIMSHARNDKDHICLLKRFIYEIDWDIERPLFQHSIPSAVLLSSHNQYQQQSLEKFPWFFNRDEMKQLNSKLAFSTTVSSQIADGEYYVRFSNDSKVLAPFTLVVQIDGQQRFIRICMNKQGQYGFSISQCYFSTIQDLINYYTQNSLSKHFPILKTDMKLTKPIQRDLFLDLRIEDDYTVIFSNIHDPHVLRITLLELTMKYNEMEQTCSALKSEYQAMITLMSEVQRSTMAYGRILTIYEKQMKLNRENIIQCQKQVEKHEFEKSYKYLETRVESFINNMQKLNDMYAEKQVKREQLYNKIESKKIEMKQYEKKIAMCMKTLEDKGIEPHEINSWLGVPDEDEPWFLPDYNREMAHSLLKTCPEGTYLIRNSSNGLYALTIVHNGLIYDCRIGRDVNQNYAFGFVTTTTTPPATNNNVSSNKNGPSDEIYSKITFSERLFYSLKDLVEYYTQHSLVEHASNLNTRLITPIKRHV
ncbi:unnamed protein product [Didymodactylos carnosus]|uniref:Phosphatidylinositol 3-kinase regulatory subunit alpha-like n=1 Tax=Didymodactylos carnosus TaxID=1234261 RepID=A0A813SIY7_9BILA|nr:unnamed protein product [Didymodactylos carnosus]CAF0887684.1 unnamed protein product [Didymodactylos carnosus]CAF3585825.1 unnamed protein product [Didymodactylos carnosus]CAF3670476.1 unnamed protein product [Didymodactylos carnosus]